MNAPLTPEQEEMAQALCQRALSRAAAASGAGWQDLELNERQEAVSARVAELLRAEGYETQAMSGSLLYRREPGGAKVRLMRSLRQETGAGVMDCKRAAEAANGDPARALRQLREKPLTLKV